MTYWDEYEKAAKEESGGGGIVCRARIETGYKAYVTGMQQVETFRAAAAADEAGREMAKAKIAELGRPQWGIMIVAFLDGAISAGKAATWQGNRYFWRDNWREKEKPGDDIVLSSLKSAGVPRMPWEGYVRIGFQDCPNAVRRGEEGKRENKQTGEMEFPTVAYVTAVLSDADYQAALAEASGGDAQADVLAAFDGELPSGLAVPKIFGDSRDTWESTVREIAEKIGPGSAPVRLANITNALTAGTDNYLGYDEAGLGASPVQVLAWMNHLGV